MAQSTAPSRSRARRPGRRRRAGASLVPLALGLSALGCGGSNVQLAGTVERTALELAAPDAELVVGVPVEVGEHVAAGQVVVQLDTAVAEADLKAYQAGRAAAAALLKEAEGEYDRVARLRKAGVSTAQSLDEAVRKRDEALAQVAEKDARIAQATKRLSDLTIRTAAAGVVDQIAFEQGERAPAGGVVAVVLSDEAALGARLAAGAGDRAPGAREPGSGRDRGARPGARRAGARHLPRARVHAPLRAHRARERPPGLRGADRSRGRPGRPSARPAGTGAVWVSGPRRVAGPEGGAGTGGGAR